MAGKVVFLRVSLSTGIILFRIYIMYFITQSIFLLIFCFVWEKNAKKSVKHTFGRIFIEIKWSDHLRWFARFFQIYGHLITLVIFLNARIKKWINKRKTRKWELKVKWNNSPAKPLRSDRIRWDSKLLISTFKNMGNSINGNELQKHPGKNERNKNRAIDFNGKYSIKWKWNVLLLLMSYDNGFLIIIN